MPGPGGGGHGGGGGRGGGFGGGGGFHGGGGGGFHGGGGRPGGGFHGGGHPGGGFHGGMHHHPPMGGGWFRGPRYYGGGGCCGGALLGPIVIILFVAFMIIYMIAPAGNNNVDYYYSEGYESADGIVYDEEVLQDYADEQYADAFGAYDGYEDNLLIVFLTSEDYYDFYYIAWVGDHIQDDVSDLLGNNDTLLGETMLECINETNYKYSLDADLAAVMKAMAEEITNLGLESNYECTEDHSQTPSKLINHTDLPLTDDTVNDALTAFTQATGIPAVIVVEEASNVFETQSVSTPDNVVSVTGSSKSRISITSVLLVAALVIIVIVLIVSLTKKKKNNTNKSDDDRNQQYRQFDDQY